MSQNQNALCVSKKKYPIEFPPSTARSTPASTPAQRARSGPATRAPRAGPVMETEDDDFYQAIVARSDENSARCQRHLGQIV